MRKRESGGIFPQTQTNQRQNPLIKAGVLTHSVDLSLFHTTFFFNLRSSLDKELIHAELLQIKRKMTVHQKNGKDHRQAFLKETIQTNLCTYYELQDSF